MSSGKKMKGISSLIEKMVLEDRCLSLLNLMQHCDLKLQVILGNGLRPVTHTRAHTYTRDHTRAHVQVSLTVVSRRPPRAK